VATLSAYSADSVLEIDREEDEDHDRAR